MSTAWIAPPLTRVKLQWALGALLLAVVPFVNDVPRWIVAVTLLVALWRYVAHTAGRRLPPSWLRLGLTFGGFFLVWVNMGTINGLDGGTALLLVMAAMKLTETARSRDLVVVVYMALFLVVVHALFDQSIGATLYAGVCIVAIVAALVQVSRRTRPERPRRAMGAAGILLAQALPLTMLLFLLFPRVPGPFWALPTSGAGTTGLSDTMEPGTISNLLRSGAVAFRVEFEGAPPPAHQRYWRGPVLDVIEGRRWRTTPVGSAGSSVASRGDEIGYWITLEPHHRTWLFALDVPTEATAPRYTRLNANAELLARSPVKERRRFRIGSFPDYRIDAEGLGTSRGRFLDVSRTENPRTRDLALRWRARHADDAAVVRAALAFFNTEPFAYTLRPPLLPARAASDAFLFDTRRGFCEHYASSFALLMRYAGIPARVVTGYQGGELNPLARHFTIRQSDAHAWNEVWLAGRGWVRVDPTAAVAPERVEDGIQGALADGESLAPLLMGQGAMWSRLRHGWDAVNAAWNEHVLGYGRRAQLDLLRRLGIDRPSTTKLVAVLTVAGVLTFAALAALLGWRAQRADRDPVASAWRRFGVKLARHKVPRAPHEGPLDYARRAAAALPALAGPIQDICRRYVAERYGATPSQAGARDLAARVRRFPTRA